MIRNKPHKFGTGDGHEMLKTFKRFYPKGFNHSVWISKIAIYIQKISESGNINEFILKEPNKNDINLIEMFVAVYKKGINLFVEKYE